MNLADYLSELLGQHNEVSVPGLGYFVRTRVSAQYNDKESKFYPPYHQVKFVPQPKDDDIFTQYIADKKNISLASSKYFTEKFISKLKEDATKGKYLFADLGSFYTDQDKLIFKPNAKIAVDPAFYGYPPINVNKLGQPLSPGDARPVFAKTVSSPVISAPAAQNIPQQQYFEEETERKRPVNIWLIILVAIAVFALALFGVYQFYPRAFDKLNTAYNKIIGDDDESPVDPVPGHKAKAADLAKKTTPAEDSIVKSLTPLPSAADTADQPRFEIIADKLQKWRMLRAEAEVAHLKSIGLDAKILTAAEAPGPMIKISVGSPYPGMDEAEAERAVLIKAGKITKKNSEILTINPKK